MLGKEVKLAIIPEEEEFNIALYCATCNRVLYATRKHNLTTECIAVTRALDHAYFFTDPHSVSVMKNNHEIWTNFHT